MSSVILSSESQQDLDLIIRLAEKLDISIKKLTKEEIEETALSIAIREGKTGEYIDPDSFLNELNYHNRTN